MRLVVRQSAALAFDTYPLRPKDMKSNEPQKEKVDGSPIPLCQDVVCELHRGRFSDFEKITSQAMRCYQYLSSLKC